mgnify:FL=1
MENNASDNYVNLLEEVLQIVNLNLADLTSLNPSFKDIMNKALTFLESIVKISKFKYVNHKI